MSLVRTDYGPDGTELTDARLGDRVDTQEKFVFAICVRNAKLQKLVETSDVQRQLSKTTETDAEIKACVD